MKIAFIGTGNVATSLRAAFVAAGASIVGDYNSKSDLSAIAQNADVYIYAVRDDVLASVVSQVHVPRSALHLHTAGSMTMDVFGDDKPHCGVFYPFQTFTKSRLVEMSKVPIFIEARGIDDVVAIYSLAQSISTYIYEADASTRAKLHLAGVFANNFTNTMYGLAQDIIRGTGIPGQVLYPLMEETLAKAEVMPAKDAQTGPAKRGDKAIMQKHLELLTKNMSTDVQELYKLISKIISNS